MKRKTLVFLVVCIIIIAALASYFYVKNRNQDERYETAKVERGTIEERITATGRIEALVTVSVGSQVSGTIKELLADYNSVVRKDQVIALLEPSIFQAQKKQAEANLASARANQEKAEVALEEARKSLKRGEELYSDSLISESEIDTLKTAYESAVAQVSVSKSQVRQAEAALSLAEVNLTHTVIASPIDGIIISRDVDVGQTVAASLQAPTLFTIANDLTKMQVHSDISESDVGKLREGQEVTFKVDAFPKEDFKGEVTQVRNEGTIVQNVVTYDAVIDVDNQDLKLKPGMTAYVSILVQKSDDSLKIPNIALRFKPSNMEEWEIKEKREEDKGKKIEKEKEKEETQGSAFSSSKGSSSHGAPGGIVSRASSFDRMMSTKPVVWVFKNGTIHPVQVSTGITDGKYSEVIEGELSEGDEVVTEELISGDTDSKGRGRPRRLF